MSDNSTDFGFQSVPLAAKKPMVRAVFDSVAPRYDLMNDLMSLGVHRAWKRDFVAALQPRPGKSLLDLAGGTGDITFGWRARRRRPGHPQRHQRRHARRRTGPGDQPRPGRWRHLPWWRTPRPCLCRTDRWTW